MRNKLIILTTSFPYGKAELFLEHEIQIIAPYFKEVEIIAVSNKNFSDNRTLPRNVIFCKLNIEKNYVSKLKIFFQFITPLFWRELLFLFSSKQSINMLKIKTILNSSFNSRLISQFIEDKITNPNETVVYSYWSNDNASAAALLKLKFKNLKTLTRAHGWDVYFEANRANYLPFRKTLLGELDNVCAVSDAGNKYIRTRWKIEPNKVVTSRLGVIQSEKVTFSEQDIIVSCSHINSIKRLHLIVEALCLFKTPIKWVHIGAGEEFDKIKQLCEDKLNINPNVSWELLGRIPNEEIIPTYLKIKPKLFINVSSTEGVPVSIMEAICCGLPVIATRVGGNPEIVNDSNGLVIDPNPTTDKLFDAIRHILELKKDDWENLSLNSVYLWDKMYNLNTNYISFVEYLKR
jgi:glycosyltransferase involved in cell wall biosynthesis